MSVKKRLTATLLCLCMIFTLMPATVFAAGGDGAQRKMLQPGTAGLLVGDKVYYGTEQGTWQVVSTNGNGGTYSDGTNTVDAQNVPFLLSDTGIFTTEFGNDDNYQGSTLQEQLQSAAKNTEYFSPLEQEAILETTKGGASTELGMFRYLDDGLNGDTVFALSANEFKEYLGYTGDGWSDGLEVGDWWMRSACDVGPSRRAAGVVDSSDRPVFSTVSDDHIWARPALNLNPNSVLFITNVIKFTYEGQDIYNDYGKFQPSISSSLEEVDAYSQGDNGPKMWRLTLLDSGRNFSADVGIANGTRLTVEYTGASVGENEYISAVIIDKDGNISHYGRLMHVTSEEQANGTVEVTLPDGFNSETDTLYLFSEQYNFRGRYGVIPNLESDYASALQEVEITNTLSMQMGADSIVAGYSVYYGADSREWQVLSTNGNGGTYSDGTNTVDADNAMFLLSKTGMFKTSLGANNNYQGSTLQGQLQDAAKSAEYFSPLEQEAILESTKNEEGSVTFGNYTYAPSSLYGDTLFSLSANELRDYLGYTSNRDTWTSVMEGNGQSFYDLIWWLRSSCTFQDVQWSGTVNYYGSPGYDSPSKDFWARPAFNLNLGSVLFASAAENGKASGDVGADALTEVARIASIAEWKLTLLDSQRGFSVDNTTIDGSTITISYKDASVGEHEYVSAVIMDEKNNITYYGRLVNVTSEEQASGTVEITLPASFDSKTDSLYLFSEQYNGDYKTDYASELQLVALTTTQPPLSPEITPSATFTATSDKGGTLSDVDTSMKYSVDGGRTWNNITGTTMEITGVTATNDVKVYKPGNNTTTSDSEVQTIDVTQAAPPTGVDKVDCTTTQQNDGQITGVDSTMEYKLSTDSGWTEITGNTVTGLTNGTYQVRVKADGTVLASTAATVTVGAHTCTAQGGWQYDETNHWKRCSSDSCNAKVDEAAHSGGTATCTAAAVCEICGQPYGEKDPDHHTGDEAWLTTATTHTKVYSCCQAVIEVETNHTWENGTCTVCQYGCEHKGGTATCSQLAQCEICGSLYGDYDLDNHKASETWTQENDKHYHICEYGCGTHLDEADCSGGEATCTEKAVCHICRQAYGSVDPDNHSGKVVWEQTATTHSSVYDCCREEAVAEEAHEWENGVCSECGYECLHSGGEATCAEKAVCHICGDEYGDVNASNHTNLVKTDAKPATHLTEGNTEYWYCDGCDKYFSDEAGTNEIALEDTVIPKLTEHTADGTGWHRDEESHWHICECGEVIDKAAHSYKWVIDKEATATEAGLKHEECSVCGYAKEQVEIPATGTTTDPSDENEKPSIGAPTDPNTSTGNNQTGTSTGNNQTDNKTSPQTGDERDLALWIFSLAISGCAIMGSVIYHKRKKC